MNDGDGLYRPIPSDRWMVPASVKADGDYLLWTYIDGDRKWGSASPGPGMLEDFIALANAGTDKIVAYAEKWGVLLLRGEEAMLRYPDGRSPEDGACRLDSLKDWRHYSAAMRSMLSIAANLHQGKPGSEEDWRRLYALSPEGRELRLWELDVAGQRFEVQLAIDEWLRIGRIRPAFTWYNGVPEIKLVRSGLFGALAVQVMLAVGGSNGIGVCSACALPFPIVGRKPNPKRRTYCRSCRKMKTPERDAARDSRRRREAKERVNGQAR